jgi:hypothetical protein
MTRNRIFPLLVAVAALAALAGTISYAAARANNGGNYGYGSMMNGSGYTMMGSSGHRMGWYLNGSGAVRTIPAARAQAQQFANRLGLKATEVIQFTGNFYVRLDDKTGKPATEVLVDPESGAVTLEYGPAMMWNTRYGMMRSGGQTGQGGMMGGSGMMGSGGMMGESGGGMMSGMMGRYGTNPSWSPSGVSGHVDMHRAHALAQRWLNANERGLTVERAGDGFPGYYTLETLKNGNVAAMISVNKRTGAVWYHWWHGRFVAMEA